MNTHTPIDGRVQRASPRRLEAVDFLLRYLKNGPKTAGEARPAAQAEDIKPGALFRARRSLGVKVKGWQWELPPGPQTKK